MPFFSGKCYSKARLDGVTAVVTGSNTGIGKETVFDFYKRGARVIMACRDLKKAEDAKEDIIKRCEKEDRLGEISIIKLDLTSLCSVRECVDSLLATEPKINLLINNAGVMLCPEGKTRDGFETQMGTNHFGHFLLTLSLLPRIINSKPARIVNVSALAHKVGHIDFDDMFFERRPYKPIAAYAQSKLANILFTQELAKKLAEYNIQGVNVYALHPGVIATDLCRHLDSTLFSGAVRTFSLFKMFLKTLESGAQTTVFCAVDEKCANETGLYYSDCVPVTPSADARNAADAEKLWNISMKLVKLEDWNPFTAKDDSVSEKK